MIFKKLVPSYLLSILVECDKPEKLPDDISIDNHYIMKPEEEDRDIISGDQNDIEYDWETPNDSPEGWY